jgi:hypothetical protein
MSSGLFTGLLVAMTIASTSTLACTGKEIFSDDFKEAGFGWPQNTNTAIGAGKAVIRPEAGKNGSMIYQGDLFENADICFDVAISEPRNPGSAVAGLIFWFDDWENWSTLLFSPDGSSSIVRFQKGKSLSPVAWRKADAIKTAANAVNKIRVTLKGNAVTAYFNDKVFAPIKMSPPAGGGKMGLYAASENDGVNTFTFTNLKITEPPR